jgi:hypothetical protein
VEKGESRSVETKIESVGDMQGFIRGRFKDRANKCIVKLSWNCVVNRVVRIANPFIVLLSQGLASASAKQSPTMPQGCEMTYRCQHKRHNVQKADPVMGIHTAMLSTIYHKEFVNRSVTDLRHFLIP